MILYLLLCFSETLKGGIGGGVAGLAFGLIGLTAAGARYPAVRQLTLPFKAFLVTSSGSFAGMILALGSSQTQNKHRLYCKNILAIELTW